MVVGGKRGVWRRGEEREGGLLIIRLKGKGRGKAVCVIGDIIQTI